MRTESSEDRVTLIMMTQEIPFQEAPLFPVKQTLHTLTFDKFGFLLQS